MGYANLSRLSSGLFPEGSNDTPVDFLTNDNFEGPQHEFHTCYSDKMLWTVFI